ncbi:hypothetical protein BDM02DRAFT_3106227 [Thelephora ganbajun]|uniref:Uncharacterized protein n=1 Tax=Thelephora ganbajun TaxID=370292 RepID=A0ACB6YXG2_THEGA|nr:hypothetical protein BDM02DRAFT_3106227 [Thelephora ganbajun]
MGQVISIKKVTAELKKNPLFACLSLVQPPRWTNDNLKGKVYGAITFTFEDRDGSRFTELSSQYLYIFGQQCLVHAWKDKVDVKQCLNCWCFSTNHTNCKLYCCLCASPDHVEAGHQATCPPCVCASNTTVSSCTHLKCPMCGKDHPGNDPDCIA